MRILLIHNKYQVRGGEDKVFEQEVEMLQKHNHEVKTLIVDNDCIKTLKQKILAAIGVAWSTWGMKVVEKEINDFKPDIAHVHNFFPLLSPSIFSVFNERKIPCVMTLHNYRLICPTATFVVDGKVNEQSLKHSSYWLVYKKFYKNSLLGSFFVARMVETHKKKGTWKNNVDLFITLTEFARSKFIESGIPADKIIVKPNFVQQTLSVNTSFSPSRHGALFVGRVSPEKGVETLMRAWNGVDYPLLIAGGGATDEMIQSAPSNVEFLGNVNPDEISALMQQASFLIMPSECYEGFPMVLVEAYSNKLPVVASDIGSLSELIIDGVTGYKFPPGNAGLLRETVNKMISDPTATRKMGQNAEQREKDLYSIESNYETLMGVYRNLVDDKLPGASNER